MGVVYPCHFELWGFKSEEHIVQTAKDATKKTSIPPLTKHFLVVIFTPISASAKHKHTLLVARYGLTSIDAMCLDKVLTEAYLIAVQVAGDGASENHSYNKMATLTGR